MSGRSLPVRIEGGPFSIESEKLSKSYGKDRALHEVSLQVPEGGVYLLVGHNGAGKTTLIRTLLDLVRPTSGRISALGLDPISDGPTLRAQIGYVPERHDWGYGWMRVDRLLRHHAAFFPNWDQRYAERLVRFFEVPLERKYGKLSKGQSRRIQLLMALAHRPRVLLLDEPTDGLDPVMRDETFGMLAEHLAEHPTTVLISTHLVHETESLADHVGVLRSGELVTQMSVDRLRAGLRRYRADVPDGWMGVPTLNGTVLRTRQTSREILWTIWGEEKDVRQHLTLSGATVREAETVTLEDAMLALLTRKELDR